MADAITSQTILDGERLFIGKFTNISDGTGETGVLKIDVSALNPNSFSLACTSVKINKIWAQTQGMSVDILWDASTDLICETIPENQFYFMDYSSFGGFPNNAGSGKTGDVLFTTIGAAAGDRYTITIEALKTYASA
jgi:hypothetical protein